MDTICGLGKAQTMGGSDGSSGSVFCARAAVIITGQMSNARRERCMMAPEHNEMEALCG
jgi:hypothetical protein